MLLRIGVSRRRLPPQSLRLQRHKLQRRARADGWHLLRRPERRRRRRHRIRRRAVLAARDRACHPAGSTACVSRGPAGTRVESGQGECAGDEPAVAERVHTGHGEGVSTAEVRPPPHRLGGHADGEESARPERHHCDQ